jgi:hypothetical protein
VELSSELAVAPSEDVVLPAAESPGTDAMDNVEESVRRYLWARYDQRQAQHLPENEASLKGVQVLSKEEYVS